MPTTQREAEIPPRREVGYFCHILSDGKHMGGILITNEIGVPLEFKYTEPVSVNRLQKALYGAVLDRHLHETVIRDSLARQLASSPRYFITGFEEKEYLGSVAGREMIALQEIRSASSEPAASYARARDREAVILTDEGPRLRAAFSTSDDAVQQDMIGWLQRVAQTMDLLEPLERVKAALRLLIGDQRKG